MSYIETKNIIIQGKSCSSWSNQNLQLKLFSWYNYFYLIFIIFYPRIKNKEYIKLSLFGKKMISSKGKRFFLAESKPTIEFFSKHNFFISTVIIFYPKTQKYLYIKLSHIKITKISSKGKSWAPKDQAFVDSFAIVKEAKPLQ